MYRKLMLVFIGVLVCGGAFASASYSEPQEDKVKRLRSELVIKLNEIKMSDPASDLEGGLKNAKSFLDGFKHAFTVIDLANLGDYSQYIKVIEAEENKIKSVLEEIAVSPCANCLDQKPFYVDGKRIGQDQGDGDAN